MKYLNEMPTKNGWYFYSGFPLVMAILITSPFKAFKLKLNIFINKNATLLCLSF